MMHLTIEGLETTSNRQVWLVVDGVKTSFWRWGVGRYEVKDREQGEKQHRREGSWVGRKISELEALHFLYHS